MSGPTSTARLCSPLATTAKSGAGSHGSTYGGSPLGCAVALKVLEVIQRERLETNARQIGEFLQNGLERLARSYPQVVSGARGMGLMLGIELAPNIRDLPGDASRTRAVRFAQMLHAAGVLAIPAGAQVLRLLPPLNLHQSEAEEGLVALERLAAKLAG